MFVVFFVNIYFYNIIFVHPPTEDKENQVDHVVKQKKFDSNINDARAYRWAEISSYYRPVRVKTCMENDNQKVKRPKNV